MKYLKYFETEIERSTYKSSSDFILPNVSYVVESDSVDFNPYVELKVPQKAGDIVYYVNGGLKTIGYADWDASLGIPVGVITIPEGFAPDGKARMLALSGVTSSGTASSSDQDMVWGGYGTDTSLTNYTKVPTTDNAGSTSTGSAGTAYLPSDKFTGTTSYVDPGTKYYNTSNAMIPSPYLTVDGKNEPNPAYYQTISGYNNALSDFSGLQNTQTLVGLGTGYTAANACWNYKDSANSGIQWYLPAVGELGYMMPRFNEINAGLAKLNAVQLSSSSYYWSSSEYSSGYAYTVGTGDGYVYDRDKDRKRYARPWAIVE